MKSSTPLFPIFLLVFVVLLLSSCQKEKTLIYKEIACKNKPWSCDLCPTGETPESL